MTQAITITDHERRTEIQLGESRSAPGRTNVVVYAQRHDDVQLVIDDLAAEYNMVTFTLPARCADGRWAAMGRVWNEVMQ